MRTYVLTADETGAEEEEQDQREDEGAADPRTQLEQGRLSSFPVILFGSCGFCVSPGTWELILLLLLLANVSQVQTDKASMLDDAIEYLKQLQLQVQVTKLTPHCLFATC